MLKKIYDPKLNSDIVKVILIVTGFVLAFISLLFSLFFKNRDMTDILWVLCFYSWVMLALEFVFKLGNGYTVLEDGMLYRRWYKKNKMLYKDMKYIIISNKSRDLKIEETPYVTVIGGEWDKILQYIADVPDGDGLASDDIRYKLHEEITRRPRYFRELMEKGSYSGYSYAFVWNTKEMHKVLKGFSGDYYIAETVPQKFHHKFGVIMEKYNINQTRIHRIAD